MADEKLAMDEQDSSGDFDEVLEAVGSDGHFQRKYNMLYNFVFMILGAMPYLNLVIAMSVPDHWCKVPGRESTNYSLEEWKRRTIPVLVTMFLLSLFWSKEDFSVVF